MNILIADDHKLYSLGLKSIIDTKTSIKLNSIDYCSNGKEVLAKLNGIKKYDFLITDLNMPKLDGNKLIEVVQTRFPKIKIIVISMYFSHKLLENLKKNNVWGYIPKGIDESEMALYLNQILNGKKVFKAINYENSIITNSDLKLNDKDGFIDSFEKKYNLTKREQEIAILMISDLGNVEISKKLFLTVETIKSHRKNIYSKTGVNSVLNLYKLIKNI
jgi:DNA-binding NarL/FixJ family response regulator